MQEEDKVETSAVEEVQAEVTVPELPAEQAEAPASHSPSEAEINWQKARETLQEQQQRIRELQMQVSQMAKSTDKDELAELSDDDILTVAQAKKLAARQAKEAALEIVRERERVSQEREVMSKYPDYEDVIKTYLKPQVQENPELLEAIQRTKNPFLTAYQMAKAAAGEASPPNPKKAEKVLKNASRPLSAAAASGLRADATSFSNMSSEEIWKMAQNYATKS